MIYTQGELFNNILCLSMFQCLTLLAAFTVWNMESSGRSRIYRGLELSHLDLPSLLQTTDLSLITEFSFHTTLALFAFCLTSVQIISFSFQSCISVPQWSRPQLFGYYMFDQRFSWSFFILRKPSCGSCWTSAPWLGRWRTGCWQWWLDLTWSTSLIWTSWPSRRKQPR